MSELKQFPEGFYWGETVRGTVARPCLIFLKFMNRNIDFQLSERNRNLYISISERKQKASFAYKVYRICKMQRRHI